MHIPLLWCSLSSDCFLNSCLSFLDVVSTETLYNFSDQFQVFFNMSTRMVLFEFSQQSDAINTVAKPSCFDV